MYNVYMQKLVFTDTKIIVNFNENKINHYSYSYNMCKRINILYINLWIEFQYIVALES